MKNKNKKRVLFNFMPYECAAVEEFLEEEASKGWLLTSISGNIFKFEKIKARKLKFTVDILGDVTFFHAEDNEEALRYRDYCEEAGWKYVCSKGKIQIFYTEDNLELIPIHTDEKEKFKQIIKASMWNVLGYAVIVALWMIVFYQWFASFGMVKTIFSSNVMILCSFIYSAAILYYSIELILFIQWIIKSRISLKENKFIPYNSYKSLKRKNKLYIIGIILALVFIIVISAKDSSFSRVEIVSVLSFFLVFMLLFYMIIKFLKKKNFKRRTNIIITILSCIVMYILFINLTVFNVLGGTFSNDIKKNYEYISNLILNDFGYEETCNKVYSSKSIIAENRSYFSEGENESFFYDTFICDSNRLFELCVNKEIKSFCKLSYEYDDADLILEMIETNLPKDVCVYANNNKLGKKYIVIGENKYISISNNFKDLDEEEFLNIIYNECFA